MKKIHFFDTSNFNQEDFQIIFQIPKLEEIIFSNLDEICEFQGTSLPNVKRIFLDCGLNQNLDSFTNVLSPLFPNLEHIILVTEEKVKDEQFLLLLELKYLKSFWIESSTHGHPAIANDITDEVLAKVVNELTYLEEFTILHCHSINGSEFSMIKNPKLKKINIARNDKYSLPCDEIDDYDFQHYYYNLKELILDWFDNEKIIDSIIKYCPNLCYLKMTSHNYPTQPDPFLRDYFIKNVSKERIEKFDYLQINDSIHF